MSIIKFNEAAAQAAGWPKDVINTVRHLVASVGSHLGQMTLPEVAAGLGEMSLTPLAHAHPLPDDPLTPSYCAPIFDDDLSPVAQQAQQIEFLQTEVRQQGEQIAVLMQQINDLKQGTP